MSTESKPAAAAAPAATTPEVLETPATDLVSKSLTTVEAQAPKQLVPYVQAVRSYLVSPLSAVEKRANAFPALSSVYKSTKVPPITFVGILALIALIVLRRVYRLNAKFLSNIIGIGYPAFASIKAVESPEADDDERWLTYWPVFGLFVLADHGSESIRKYFPIYFTTKIAVLYWLFSRNGALLVYRRLFRPLLVKYGGLASSANGTTPASTA